MPGTTLSDKAVGIFAFAAYHQLSAGEAVTNVVLHDAAGHAADPQAVEEITAAGLAVVEDDRAVFTDAGKTLLAGVLEALRAAAGSQAS